MTGTTISGSYTTGFTFNSTASNPVSVTGQIVVANTTASAIYGVGGSGTNSWTIANSGTLSSSTANSTGAGIKLGGASTGHVLQSSITNMSGGTISGFDGIYIYNSTSQSGTITNQSGASIAGYGAGIVTKGQGVVINSGAITGGKFQGVDLVGGGSVTNMVGGTISGKSSGVQAAAATTITNAGTISAGSGGYAVHFLGGGASNLLIADPGAVFVGTIAGGTGNLELASGTSTGTIAGFSNFGTLTFDPGAQWIASGNTAAFTNTSLHKISGFTQNDTIDLMGFVATGSVVSANSLKLTNAASASVTMNILGVGSSTLQITNDGTNTFVTELCFLPGTLIRTPKGDVKVEDLSIGDTAVTLGNFGSRKITWIGKGKVLATRMRRGPATPVIVRKGAIADNVPFADLHVTKAHGINIDNVLIPAEFLVNHRSIVWDDRAQEVTLYHVELDAHDVLLANGAPAESFRDDGNRWLFQNAHEATTHRRQPSCLPVLTGGPIVDAAWKRLLNRAGPRALPPMTDDPDLHLMDGDRRIEPSSRNGRDYVFDLPAKRGTIRIVSRDVIPAEFGFARDSRVLGVAVRRIVARHGQRSETIEANDASLTDGFHDYEATDNRRWTNGNATIPVQVFERLKGTLEVVLTLVGETNYLDHGSGPTCQIA